MPSPAGGPVIGSSLSDNVPEVAMSRPAISLSRVLLPQPLGPSRLTNSPLWIASETLVRASTSPRGDANDFDTLSIRMCGLVAPEFSVSLFVIGDKFSSARSAASAVDQVAQTSDAALVHQRQHFC